MFFGSLVAVRLLFMLKLFVLFVNIMDLLFELV